MSRINTETILSLFLGFVVLWFGYNEITNPAAWAVFVPTYLNVGEMVNNLVIAHGAVLAAAGLAMIFNFHRRLAAGLIALLILGIVTTLLQVEGLTDVSVRDIGLLGMALALATRN